MLISKLDKDITRKDNYRWISFQKSSMKYSKSNPAMYKKIYTRTKWDLFHLCKAGSTLNQLYHISRLKRKRINDYINRFRKSTWENSIHIHDKNFQGTGNKRKYLLCNKKNLQRNTIGNIIPNGKIKTALTNYMFPSRLERKKQACSLLLSLFNILLEVLTNAMK